MQFTRIAAIALLVQVRRRLSPGGLVLGKELLAEARAGRVQGDGDVLGLLLLDHLDQLLDKYKDRQVKIAAVTSCSNVTGVFLFRRNTPIFFIQEFYHFRPEIPFPFSLQKLFCE